MEQVGVSPIPRCHHSGHELQQVVHAGLPGCPRHLFPTRPISASSGQHVPRVCRASRRLQYDLNSDSFAWIREDYGLLRCDVQEAGSRRDRTRVDSKPSLRRFANTSRPTAGFAVGQRYRKQKGCCFSLCLVESPRQFAGLFRRRIAWDDEAIREALGADAVAFVMGRCCRGGEDVGARSAECGPGVGKCAALVQALSTRSTGRRSLRRMRPHPHRLASRGVGAVISAAPSDNTGVGPRGWSPAGPRPVQLRYETGLTGEQYVQAEAWRAASLERCPNHPHGGLFAGAPRHLRAQHPARDAERSRVLSRQPHPPSACWRTVWPLAFPVSSTPSKRWWPTPSRPRVWPAAANALRRDAVELPRGDALGRAPGSSRPSRREPRHRAPPRTARPVHSPRWAQCARASRPRPRSEHCVRSSPSNSAYCPPRWGSTPTVSARRIAIARTHTTWGLTRRRRLHSVASPGP